jgi:hypothetical protein
MTSCSPLSPVRINAVLSSATRATDNPARRLSIPTTKTSTLRYILTIMYHHQGWD